MTRDLTPRLHIGRLGIGLEFKANDLWVGLYARRWEEAGFRWFECWVCLVPMLPVHITLRLGKFGDW